MLGPKEIKAVMLESLMDGRAYAKPYQEHFRKLGESVGYGGAPIMDNLLDGLAYVVWQRMMADNEEELDKGVTVDPKDFEVTDELIEEISNGKKKKNI